MKKFATIFFAIIFSAIQLQSQVLSVSQAIQEKDQWDWAAASASILDYYCSPVSQCIIAEYVRSSEQFADIDLGTVKCCDTKNTCNTKNYATGGPGSIEDILNHFAGLSCYTTDAEIDLATLTAEFQANKPFIINWTMPNGATHFVVCYGIENNIIYYMDPAVGKGFLMNNYDWMVSGDGHKWSATTRITDAVNSKPSTAGAISGKAVVCKGDNAVVYSVAPIANAISYVWSLPNGAFGTSNTSSITVSYSNSAAPGNVYVKGRNSCGDGGAALLKITVNLYPAAPGSITGATTVCQGQNNVKYTVPTIANATSYVWTLPDGVTGTSTTNSINVNFGPKAISGPITVCGSNDCGKGVTTSFSVSVNAVPASIGSIKGTTVNCQGQENVTYSIPVVPNTTSYTWTLPNGVTGTSVGNSITVKYTLTAQSGDITVTPKNTCGYGPVATLPVFVTPKPATPKITLTEYTLHSDSPVGNQWYNLSGPIAGATDQDFTVTVKGDYYVIVNVANCNSSASNTIYVMPISGVENSADRTINVYPNPVSNELVIEIANNTELVNFEIINSLGEVVYKNSLTDKTIVQTDKFAPGAYYVKLATGKTIEFKKLIKE